MKFRLPFLPRKSSPQPHTEVRYFAATRKEGDALRTRQAAVRLQLAVYNATTTAEQRLAETEAYFARARETQEQRFQRIAKDAFRGVSV